jgi:hypothetical protein
MICEATNEQWAVYCNIGPFVPAHEHTIDDMSSSRGINLHIDLAEDSNEQTAERDTPIHGAIKQTIRKCMFSVLLRICFPPHPPPPPTPSLSPQQDMLFFALSTTKGPWLRVPRRASPQAPTARAWCLVTRLAAGGAAAVPVPSGRVRAVSAKGGRCGQKVRLRLLQTCV